MQDHSFTLSDYDVRQESERVSQLHQLIYASAATEPFVASKLAELLVKARANNTGLGLTGMLLHNSGSFIQVLEGDHDVVEALYARIQNDPRHTNNRLLFRGAVADREFAQWSMAFINVRRDLTPDGFVDYHAELEQALVDGSRARRVLKMFRDGSWRQTAPAAL